MSTFTAPSFAIDDLFSVKGRTVVITGGGSGLGKGRSQVPDDPSPTNSSAVATAYVQNGAKVFISGRRKEVLEATAKEITSTAAGKNGSITTVQGDVGTKAGCKKLFDDISQLTPVVDVLVNCAGVMRNFKNPTTDVDNSEQERA